MSTDGKRTHAEPVEASRLALGAGLPFQRVAGAPSPNWSLVRTVACRVRPAALEGRVSAAAFTARLCPVLCSKVALRTRRRTRCQQGRQSGLAGRSSSSERRRCSRPIWIEWEAAAGGRAAKRLEAQLWQLPLDAGRTPASQYNGAPTNSVQNAVHAGPFPPLCRLTLRGTCSRWACPRGCRKT